VGAMRSKHLETTYECCASDANSIIRQWALARSFRRLTVVVRISQSCALHFHRIKNKACFFIKLNHLALKDDNNHCHSEMLRQWNDEHSWWLLTCKGMDGTFKFWYFAGYTVHLILMQRLIIFQTFSS